MLHLLLERELLRNKLDAKSPQSYQVEGFLIFDKGYSYLIESKVHVGKMCITSKKH